jgi:hypothetical protein
MGYPAIFNRWLQTMYSVADISILKGSEVAGTICEIPSVRQGCSLDSFIFFSCISNHCLFAFRMISREYGYLIKNRAFVDVLHCFCIVMITLSMLDLYVNGQRQR